MIVALSSLIAEAHGHDLTSWVDEYIQLLHDPAHILFELTFSVVFDFLIVYLGYQIFIKRVVIPRLRHEIHQEIDDEHHVAHHEHQTGDNVDDCEVEL